MRSHHVLDTGVQNRGSKLMATKAQKKHERAQGLGKKNNRVQKKSTHGLNNHCTLSSQGYDWGLGQGTQAHLGSFKEKNGGARTRHPYSHLGFPIQALHINHRLYPLSPG